MKKNNTAFYLVIVIIVSAMMMLFWVIVFILITNDYYFLDDTIVSRKIYQNRNNTQNMILKFYETTNNDWVPSDKLSCSWWIIVLQNSITNDSNLCTWEWAMKPDWIDDKWNNDDFKSTFYNVNIWQKLDISARIYDNDDYARKYVIWVIYPEETKTVFFINDNLINSINSNKNNIWDFLETKVPRDILNMNINIALSNINAKISVFRIDKSIYNSSKDISIIEELSWEAKTLTGYLVNDWNINNSWMPYIFDIHNYDYALNIKNTSTWNVLTYDLKWISNEWKEVYIVWITE